MQTTIGVRLFLLLIFILATSNISYGEQAASMTVQFYIQKNQVERDAILLSLKTFEIGLTTIENVKSKLGPAYSEAPNFGPKGKRMERTGSILTYYLVKKDENLVNSKTDEYVKLIFDNNDILIKVKSNGVNLHGRTP